MMRFLRSAFVIAPPRLRRDGAVEGLHLLPARPAVPAAARRACSAASARASRAQTERPVVAVVIEPQPTSTGSPRRASGWPMRSAMTRWSRLVALRAEGRSRRRSSSACSRAQVPPVRAVLDRRARPPAPHRRARPATPRTVGQLELIIAGARDAATGRRAGTLAVTDVRRLVGLAGRRIARSPRRSARCCCSS